MKRKITTEFTFREVGFVCKKCGGTEFTPDISEKYRKDWTVKGHPNFFENSETIEKQM